VLYTDGVTEAENDAGQSLDREHSLQWAQEAPTDSPQAVGRALLQRLESFQGRCRNDDETLVVLQRGKVSFVSLLIKVARRSILRMLRGEDEPSVRTEQPAAPNRRIIFKYTMIFWKSMCNRSRTLEVEMKNGPSP
jgi:Stage II sporulation protein E (SpoIIE)